MFNEDGKLIVIHQYPTRNLQPFLNPICKDTFNALPKVYGKISRKRYIQEPITTPYSQNNRLLRDCCSDKYQEKHRVKTDMKMSRKIRINSVMTEDNPIKYQSQGKKTKQKRTMPTLSNIMLPSLKGFQTTQLSESQTKHKVYIQSHNTSLDQQSIPSSRNRVAKSVLKKDRKKAKQFVQSSDQSVQTQQRFFQFPNARNSQGDSSKKVKTEAQKQQNTKRYYQYLQNDTKVKQTDSRILTSLRLSSKKALTTTSEDDTFSISSSVLKQKKGSTMFHKVKQKFQDTTLKQSRSGNHIKDNSILSNGLFKIPEEQQFGDYLLNYQPMSKNFDLKNLVKEADFHIIPDDGRVYFGQVANNKRHGKGITISQKQIYQGKYDKDVKIQGCQKNRDGVYKGEFQNGKRHGKGQFAWYNGQLFEGQWKNGKKNGFGIWKSPKGDYYEGQWANNRQTGKGLYFHIGGSKYQGQFKQFLKHGKGIQQFPNGDHYSGQYSNGKPHGEGKYNWCNGDSYQGTFKQGSRQGFGKMKSKKGQIYQGYFKNDLKHGHGKQHFTKTGQLFQGQFSRGQRVKGILKTSKGAVIQLNSQ